MEFAHIPVMLKEVISGLDIKKGGVYADGTLGGAGHSEEILKSDETVRLIAIDKDIDAIEFSKKRLSAYGGRVTFVRDDFKNIKSILNDLNIEKIDGALLDLGVSSFQLDNFERGFSYRADNFPLDMRMDKRQSLSAYGVVNGYDIARLTKILREYGEEKFAYNIAKNIIRQREIKSVETCGELTGIICRSIPAAARRTGGNPAKRTFQAIRIEVNGELEGLGGCIEDYTDVLKTGGRLCVITFHSLEDRTVKHKFRDLSTGCVCPPKTPVCICGHKASVKLINNKPVEASAEELKINPRSESAKLRICEKI